jgi:hypothetical protein
LDRTKLILLALVIAALSVVGINSTIGEVLGSSALEFEFVVGVVVFYVVLSLPSRLTQAEAFSQSREAPALAAMASITLEVTHSRSSTMMMLRSTNPGVSAILHEIRRSILLGNNVESATADTVSKLASYSAANALTKTATLRPESIKESELESLGLMNTFELEKETKLPLFTTACFFVPILLLLFAAFSHLGDPKMMIELTGLQIVTLDLAYYFSSSARGKHQ